MLSRHAPPRAEELHRQADAPPTMDELAERLVLDRSALGHNLRPLEHDGPVAVVAGDNDRRRRRVVLTTRGRAKFGQARRAWKLTASTTCSANQQQRNSEPPCVMKCVDPPRLI
jgi:DNA-binding MarR family transcriptional regulator